MKIKLTHIVRQRLLPTAIHALAQGRRTELRSLGKRSAALRRLDIRRHAARADIPQPLLPLPLSGQAAGIAISFLPRPLGKRQSQHGTRHEELQLRRLAPAPWQEIRKEEALPSNAFDESFQLRLFTRRGKLAAKSPEKDIRRALHAHLLKPAAISGLSEMHGRIESQGIDHVAHADRPPFSKTSSTRRSSASSTAGLPPSEKHSAEKP